MEKRKISELKTLYLLEPSIVDVFVEGNDDASFYRYHAYAMGSHLTFKDISLVDFGDDWNPVVQNLEKNNRDKIIELVQELTNEEINNVYGIIDRDILEYTRGLPENPHILVTDYSCVEMYFFCKRNTEKVQKQFNQILSPSLIEQVFYLAKGFSHILIAEKRKNLSITKIDSGAKKYLNQDGMCVDWDGYLRACLGKSNMDSYYDEIRRNIESISSDLKTIDSRQYINGHMVIHILSLILKKRGISMDSDMLHTLYKTSVETCFLEKEELFIKLINLSKNKQLFFYSGSDLSENRSDEGTSVFF